VGPEGENLCTAVEEENGSIRLARENLSPGRVIGSDRGIFVKDKFRESPISEKGGKTKKRPSL